MNSLSIAIEKIFKGAAKSFYRFPAAIVSAIIISITAIVKITLEWEIQKKYNFLFDSIQIACILGAVFSMATIIFSEIRSDKKKSGFILVSISGILLALIAFLLLYFLGGRVSEDKMVYLSSIAMARVSAAIFISAVAFIYAISKAKSVNNFSDSFFITHRAFIISAIYGVVIMAGVSGVLGAFQALVYRGMDYRVYAYLGVAVGFLTYTMFLGYFPSFKEQEDEVEIKRIIEQPRFIFVLFEYILIPIIMALTVVLLIWSVTTILRGIDVSFNRLSGIASSYVIIGIWLHIMVSKHQTKMAQFYKRAYPFAGVLILVFEAWALFVQLNKFGLRTAEYSFIMIWIFAMISVLLLVFLEDRAYRKIAVTATVISIIWVLPIIGYQDITFNSQIKRLEKILVDQELLVNNNIIAKDTEIQYVKRGDITEAVDFISNSEKSNTPNWFKKNLNDEKVFKNTFGFEKTYGVYPDPLDDIPNSFSLKAESIDISDYSLSLSMNQNINQNSGNTGQVQAYTFETKKGNYEITVPNESVEVPTITIKLENKVIIEKDMSKYLSNLLIKYPSKENNSNKVPFEDMNLTIELEDISILFVFENIESYFDRAQNKTLYYVNPQGIYVKYK